MDSLGHTGSCLKRQNRTTDASSPKAIYMAPSVHFVFPQILIESKAWTLLKDKKWFKTFTLKVHSAHLPSCHRNLHSFWKLPKYGSGATTNCSAITADPRADNELMFWKWKYPGTTHGCAPELQMSHTCARLLLANALRSSPDCPMLLVYRTARLPPRGIGGGRIPYILPDISSPQK